MHRDPAFDRRVELGAIALSGGWSLAALLCFAGGHVKAGYTLLAIGTVAATSVALIRTATMPDEALMLREELGTEPRP